jgi:hypothetical protein
MGVEVLRQSSTVTGATFSPKLRILRKLVAAAVWQSDCISSEKRKALAQTKKTEHGNKFDSSPVRSGNQERGERGGGIAGAHLLLSNFYYGRTEPFFATDHRVRGVSGRADGFDPRTLFRSHGAYRRPEHSPGIQGEDWCMGDRVVPDSDYADDAQFLGRARRSTRAGSDGSFLQERVHAGRSAADLSTGNGSVQPGCAAFA